MDWDGVYLDGRTPVRRPARVRLSREGLEVETGGGTFRWRYVEVRQTQGFHRGEPARLERGAEITEALVVDDPAFLASVRAVAGEGGHRFRGPRRPARRLAWVAGSAAGLAVLVAALYLWAIPLGARLVAALVPVAWEAGLGRSVAESLAPSERRCVEPGAQRALGELLARVTAPLGPTPYTFRVWVLDAPSVNAFAVPGGHIVLFHGLLAETRSPEELAGVLAHEVQHVVLRHSTRALLERASLALLVGAVTGDPTGAAAVGADAARLLGTLRYGRQAEAEADREGLRLLNAAGIDPEGLPDFLQRLEGNEGRARGLDFLSTHPGPAERVAALRELARGAPALPRPLLAGYRWADMAGICAVRGGGA